ncbi:hypothetical protein CFC21_046871 [Triticum aestivum]|uniref:Glabrous enhancer-binding protein-like DBD domain-containing protein n=3 Tax=Triticinae TaxID=1648030 RepID=A0A9R1FWB1_WHEAT|nr:probable transcription factor At3g04930 [Aegilops tauschii subsp. strangulata]XP_044356335.1 probable transcription factor At3g04930 [Triticum aestivum]KAF7036119.1 hypothetical protein CFC21_046871 [Triticum aestivum]
MASAAPSRSRSSSSADQDEEGTDSDASNDSHPPTAQEAPPPPFPDSSAPPPPAPAALPDPAGAGPVPPPPPQGASAAEDSRRLFQRLWTDEEELLILRGFLEFTSRRGTAFASHQYDTGPFYEEIRRKLSFDFSKNQLIEKLRRLKKKYRVCATRVAAQGAAFAFKSAHEGAIYDVARHIWRPAFKRDGDASDEDDINPAEAAAVAAAAAAAAATEPPAAVEEGGGGGASAHTPRGRGSRRGRKRTAPEIEAPIFPATPAPMLTDAAQEPAITAFESSVPVIAQPPSAPAAPLPPYPLTANGPTEADVRSILSPLLKELISSVAVPGQTGLGLGLGMGFGGADILGAGLGVAGLSPRVPGDEKWRQQQILELEVYLKRLELVREQVMTVLQELRSSDS